MALLAGMRTACIPVQTVMGRPAAVLPSGETWTYEGGGAYYAELRSI
jgi:hypothetical protein